MADQPPLKRRTILKLEHDGWQRGSHHIEYRSFPTAKKNYFRIYKDQPLNIDITFKDTSQYSQAPIVYVHNNFDGHWNDLPLENTQNKTSNTYSITIDNLKCGLFQFKIKYSFDQGKTWYWDNVPHSHFFVDPPGLKNIKLYTMIPTVSGHIGDWKKLLHHIKNLGFNAIHLLPITAVDKTESPYAADDLFTIDHSYADPQDPRSILEQFEDFVREAKNLKIKLCIDIVLNHIGINSQMVKNRVDWLCTDESENDSIQRAGCWDQGKWIVWRDLALINYNHPNKSVKYAIWHYMKEYTLFWINYAAYTDGMIRFDNLHSSDPSFLKFLSQHMKERYPNLIILAELFADPPTTQKFTYQFGIHLLTATPWMEPYAEQVRKSITKAHKDYPKIQYLFPLSSHDSSTPANEYGDVKSTVPRYAAYALLGTGNTGMVQGCEFGIPQKIDFIGRKSKMPLSKDSWGIDFGPIVKKIHELIYNNPLFQTYDNINFIDDNHGAIIAAYRFEKENPKFGYLIIVNFDPKNPYKLKIDLSKNAPDLISQTLYDISSTSEAINLSKPIFKIEIEPSAMRIFSTKSE